MNEATRYGATIVRSLRLTYASALESIADLYDGLAMNGVPMALPFAQRIDPDQPLSTIDALRGQAARMRLNAYRHPIE
jgi:hypothetical protein